MLLSFFCVLFPHLGYMYVYMVSIGFRKNESFLKCYKLITYKNQKDSRTSPFESLKFRRKALILLITCLLILMPKAIHIKFILDHKPEDIYQVFRVCRKHFY